MTVQEGTAAAKPKLNIFLTSFIEMFGSFWLGYAGLTAAVYYTIGANPRTLLYVAVTFGVALMLLVYVLFVTGCHLNPLVTIGLSVAGKFPKHYVLPYVVSQMIGYSIACIAIWFRFGDAAITKAALGAAIPAPGTSLWQHLLIGAVAGFMFVIVIIMVAGDSRSLGQAAGIVIGLSLALGIYFSAKFAGGGLNTAREWMPLLWSKILSISSDGFVATLDSMARIDVGDAFWFVVGIFTSPALSASFGEIFGALLAGLSYRLLFSKAENPSNT